MFASLWLTVANALSACPMPLPTIEATVKGAQLKLEVAATPEARECGLSKRNTLAADKGMLFVVPEPTILDFWMANTTLPLSIAYLDSDGRILSIHHMKPTQIQEHYRSSTPARYAIEVNEGWFAKHHIDVGDVIVLRLPVMLLVR